MIEDLEITSPVGVQISFWWCFPFLAREELDIPVRVADGERLIRCYLEPRTGILGEDLVGRKRFKHQGMLNLLDKLIENLEQTGVLKLRCAGVDLIDSVCISDNEAVR